MGILIATIIQCLTIPFLTFLIFIQMALSDERITTAYNSSYHEAYNQAYDLRYQEGYDKGYQSGLEIGYKEGLAAGINLRNPTYKELMDFLARDETDLKPHIEDEYVCDDFSAEVNYNAELEGIRAAYVYLSFPGLGRHAIVAFETIDRGLIFIEPQSDREVELVIGEPFPWYQVGAWTRDYDDPIIEIQIIW